MTTWDSQSAKSSWLAEKSSALLYHHVAMAEKGTPREKLFTQLGEAAEEQAQYWEQALLEHHIALSPYQPDLRTKMVIGLIQLLGPRAIQPILASMKVRGLSVYLGEVPGHAPPEEIEGKMLEKHHHALKKGGNLRAAVFGINDGLVSNASLILGIAGASSQVSFIVLSGIAGLCAGAFSMAAGEYISVRSQTELFEHQIALEKAELEQYPEEEAHELSYIYQARGLTKIDADIFAHKLLANQSHALKTLAREELGLDPDILGSPWGAAVSSFFSFALGGFIPLLPFLCFSSKTSLTASIALTGLSLFSVGAVLSLFTGKNALYSGLRMLAIGSLAGITTYFIGSLVGSHIY